MIEHSIHPRIDPSERRTIRGWREYLLLTQAELGERAGVTRMAVYNWEHYRRTPRINMRRAIASVFAEYGVGVEQIIWPSEENVVGETRVETSEQRHAS